MNWIKKYTSSWALEIGSIFNKRATFEIRFSWNVKKDRNKK